ncbi:hypothetical protein Sjap_010205 [Stephania japonica]|uniref:Uncharacterized protein n=1 Tax=Stephania japonica TaxID=461633 RepID=A0AAP0J959_9MAGN
MTEHWLARRIYDTGLSLEMGLDRVLGPIIGRRDREINLDREQDFRARRVRWQQDHDFINDRDLRNDQYDYDDGQIDWSREDDQTRRSMINSIIMIARWYMRLYLYR